jgi:DnaJ-class molecular chaperone
MGLLKYCRRCGGTGVVARLRGKSIKYEKCPRCAGKGGKRAKKEPTP